MPMEDFLAGTALFVAMLAAVGAATWLVVRRRLRHLDPLARGLAAVVVGTGVLIGVHLVPLALGILGRATVLAAAGVAVGLAVLVRPARATAAEPAPAPAARSGPASWALAGVAAAFALAAALADLARWGGDELVGVDPLTFHLPNVGRWIQTGSLWQIDQFVPLQAHGNYPNNGDVVLLSTVLPWDNDFLVRLPIAFFLAVTAVAVYAVARELRAPRAAAVLAGAAAVSIPVVGIASIPRALPDPLLWSTLSIGVLFLLRRARTGRTSDLVLAGAALAIAAGTKWYGVSSVAVIVVVWTLARMLPRGGTAAPRGDRRRGDRRRPGVPRRRHVVRPQPRRIRQPGLPREDRALRRDDLRRAARRPARAGRLQHLRLPRRRGRAEPARRRGLRGPRRTGDRVRDRDPRRAGDRRPARRRPGPRCSWPPPRSPSPLSTRSRRTRRSGSPTTRPWRASTPATRCRRCCSRCRPSPGRPAACRGRARSCWRPALALAVVLGARSAYAVQARDLVVAAVVLALLAVAAWALWPLRVHRPLLVAAAVAAVLVGLAGAHRMEERINDGRYLGADPAIDVLLRTAPENRRIGLAADWSVAGLTPIWPSFGTRIGNEVEYVGEDVDGWLTKYGDRRSFQRALRRGRYDLLVVGRGFFPPQNTREQRWALAAGWRTVALSPRLRVLAAPRSAR